MKKWIQFSLVASLLGAMILPTLPTMTQEVASAATGYTQASDVDYNDNGEYIANWGSREEDCKFLSTYAQSFYTGNYSFEALSANNGGSTQDNAKNSALYSALKSMMSSKHNKKTSYDETRAMYRYTDCEEGNYSTISSFYSGTSLKGSWDSGKTWNREHTWPNSKGLGGQDENDIMMLRPTSVSENSSRGNTAYGESSGYYHPNSESDGKYDLRGDCARIVLYVYTRWGNTSYMWGNSGVMENMSVLLKWMEADPVDTWEMGRNDAVQSITGTRNVFVDYPEFAWLLFGKNIPDNMSTPSGNANNGQGGAGGGNSSHEHSWGAWTVVTNATTTQEGSQKRVCACGEEEWKTIPKLEDSGSSSGGNSSGDEHEHNYSDWIMIKEPTETEDGEKRRTCLSCGDTEIVTIFPNGDEHHFTKWEIVKEPTETEKGYKSRTCMDEGCGYHDVEVLPKLVNTPTDSGLNTDSIAAVGCESAIISGTSLLSVAIFLGCAIVYKKGKEE